MTPKKFSPLLLLCFTTPVSGFREVDHLPETFCITYLSTYLVAISGVQTDESSSVETSFLLSSVVDDFTSDTQDRKTSYSISLDDPLSTLATEVSVTRSFLTNTETSTADPTVIPGPDGRAVVFRVIPSSEDNNRRFYRRALGGFVGSQSDLCEDAVVYNLSQDRLYEDGLLIYYNGESYKELRGQAGPLPRGAVTTAFLDDGGFVEFVSSTLPGGRAGFCQVLESGQVYLTFGSSPPDCAPVRLSIIGGMRSLSNCESSTNISFLKLRNVQMRHQHQTFYQLAPVSQVLSRTLRQPPVSQLKLQYSQSLPKPPPLIFLSLRIRPRQSHL